MQAEFIAELFEQLHKNGISTAIDTASVKINDAVKRVLTHTDTVLCDIKFPTDAQYREYIGLSLDTVTDFLALCDEYGCDVIVRHVVVPGMTDSEENIKKVADIAKGVKKLQKIELLPFQKLCVEKYRTLGLPFPLENTPECDHPTVEKLKKLL